MGIVNGQIGFKQYSSNNGLANNTVFSISQDADGFMWFGTADGLSRFDGHSFRSYYFDPDNDNSVPGRSISQLFTDQEGGLWVIADGRLGRFEKGSDTFRSYLSGRSLAMILYQSEQDLFLGTRAGLMKFDREQDKFETVELFNKELNHPLIYHMVKIPDAMWWLFTNKGVFTTKDLLNPIDLKREDIISDTLDASLIRGVKTDKQGKIYLGLFGEGITIINPSKGIIDPLELDLSSREVLGIEWSDQQELWIGTEQGVNIYDPQEGTIQVYKQNHADNWSLSDNAVYPVFRDKHDNMWVGTYFGGVNVHLKNGNYFRHYKAGSAPYFLSGKAVSQLAEDRKGNLWIGTEDGGLSRLNPSEQSIAHFIADGSPGTLSYVNVHALLLDTNDDLWVGTYLGGLNRFDGKVFEHFKADPTKKYSLNSNNIYALAQNGQQLLIGTTEGMSSFDLETQQFSRVHGLPVSSHVYDILIDDDQEIWVATYGNGLFLKTHKKNEFTALENLIDQKFADRIPRNVIFLSKTRKNLLLIGTVDEGLYTFDLTTKQLSNYSLQEGLPSATVYSAIEDNFGHWWLTTNNGLVRMDPISMDLRIFTGKDGLGLDQFNYKSGFKHSSGNLFFGTVDGLVMIDPTRVRTNDRKPELKLVDFQLFNRSVKTNDKSGILKTSIQDTESLELDHRQNAVGFEFSIIDFTSPKGNKYAYKLEGYEDQWNYTGNYNKANYSNLPAGEYLFRVKGSNGAGVWNEEGIQLPIRVNPSFWSSSWGYILYAFLFSIFLYTSYRMVSKRRKEKWSLIREREERERLQEINKMKLEFYTNLSHELRTPLSLILDPLARIIEENPGTETQNELKMIFRNAQKMLELLNQLLDFRKSESAKFQLKVDEHSITEFFKVIHDRFTAIMKSKGILFEIEINAETDALYFDKDILEIIVSNLLSNAVKYTLQPASVKLKVAVNEQETVRIEVVNGVTMMKPDQLSRIFDRFYQTEQDATKIGSGIGLALVKSLSILHHGEVHASFTQEDETCFRVEIPGNKEAYLSEMRIPVKEEKNDLITESFISVTEGNSVVEFRPEISLLIVEDNSELRDYLQEKLGKHFKVLTAENGVAGIQLAKKFQPSLIISDIMMPKMDGLELCAKIKEAIETSHIPVILLTARTGHENQLEGWRQGADLYHEKPFNTELLIEQIHGLLRQKKQYLARFEKEYGIEVKEVTRSNRDEEFLKTALEIVYQHLDNSDFNISEFTRAMSVSRSMLHMKLKEITGKSSTEFIRFIRLKEAAKMLVSSSISISEVADRTGFSDLSYFSKSFKKQFGSTPSDYISRSKSRN